MSNADSTDNIRRVIPIMNEVSPTFCLAKWHHTSIYLHTGQTHSCYHPRPHDISLNEIATNPSALHNTRHKKQERAMMLVGEKPKGCQYCWNVESLSDNHISDRMIRNASIYTIDRLEEIRENTWNYDINPEYIELAFSNECNFKCGYCHPMSSTSFQQEIKKHGPYETVKNHRLDIDWFNPYEEERNPYIKAWWEWWPEMSKTLNILRITGGEPTMHRSTWELFDRLRADPRPHLELNLNSNLGVKSAFIEKLANNVNDLLQNNKVKQFKLFSSMDTWGQRAEYLRTGLDIELWEKNLDIYITKTKSPVAFMCTFNILSVTSFTQFLEKVLEWRKKYDHLFPAGDVTRKVRFDTPYLKEPLQYDMQILPKQEYLKHFDNILQFIQDNKDENDRTRFSDLEYERFRRVRDYFANVDYSEERVNEGRKDFYNWFTEYDRRRNVNFVETFPDMIDFWNLCKQEAEKQHEQQ
jgi:organic radical activating enzyme